MKGAICIAALVSVGLLACSDDRRELDGEETRFIMGQIFSALRVVLPLSQDPADFANPENHARIARSLHDMSTHTEVLEAHVDPGDLQLHYLARNVADDAAEARRAFDAGRLERSAFLVGQITENCIVCHSRLPSPGDSPLARDFVAESALASLSPEATAALQIATRRFDDALEGLEALLGSPEPAPLLLGPITDHLVVSIRVKNDPLRARRMLERFAQRPDLWEQLRVDVERWISALLQLSPTLSQPPSLALARSVFEAGLLSSPSHASRGGLAHYVVASAILERLIVDGDATPSQRAEAYYLLGVIEARIGRNYWVTEAPFLLESAIRMAPTAPFARDAYALLEREMLLEYEGTEWEALPPADTARLAVLRTRMAEANAEARGPAPN